MGHLDKYKKESFYQKLPLHGALKLENMRIKVIFRIFFTDFMPKIESLNCEPFK